MEDKDKWLIDEEAAQTVRYIFKPCYDGLGPTQIAKKLKTEKVLIPTTYKAQKDGKLLFTSLSHLAKNLTALSFVSPAVPSWRIPSIPEATPGDNRLWE